MKKNRLFLPLGLVLFVFSLGLGFYFVWQEQGLGLEPSEIEQAKPSAEIPFWTRSTDRINPRETLSEALARQGLSAQQISELVTALANELNPKAIRAGDVLIIEKDLQYAQPEAPFATFELVRQEEYGLPVRYRVARNELGVLQVGRIEVPVTQQRTILSGRISSSLYEGILGAGGDPALVNRFSDLFGWQLDFYREAKKGDAFKMIVESLKKDEEREDINPFKPMVIIGMAVATSIDALIVGVSFAFIDVKITLSIVVIGFMTYIVAMLGMLFGKNAGKWFGKKIEIIGGIILIGIGVKILLEHLFHL